MFYAALFFSLLLSVGAGDFDLTEIEPEDIPTFEEYMETGYLFCNQDQFRCSDGKCISLDLVCNGEADCRNSDDEGGLCAGCEDYGCGDKCQNYPTGPRCMCPPHMFLSVDGHTCEFEERCIVGGQHNCSQHCKQVMNHVSCLCSSGYTLTNGFDCVLNSEHRLAYLFIVSNESAIHRFSLYGNSSEDSSFVPFVPKTDVIKKISSVAFNRANQMLYFVADEGHRHMKLYVSNGIESRSLYFGFAIKHIATDWVADNIYYAADGLGIGVCKGDGRFCRHLITANKPMPEQVEKFGELIVHPMRGILIYLHYSPEHPTGVIMAAGMDGKKPRILTQLTMSYVTSLSIDYVMDRLYFVESGHLFFLDLHTLLKHSVNHLRPPSAMIAFDDHLFYVSRFSPPLFTYNSYNLLTKFNKKTLKEEVIFQETFIGTHFPMAINNSIYYTSMSNPCVSLGCSHMCVLSEVGVDKMPKATCICPDKYRMDEESGVCILHLDIEGPVRTSVSNMEEMCAQNHACFNGGTCPDNLDKSADITPFCDCPAGFNGLYCEVRLPGIADDASSVFMILFLLFIFVLIAISLAVIALKMYPGMRQRFETLSNMSPSSSERSRRSSGASIRPKDNSATPMLSRSPSANFSSSLLRNVEQPAQPIQITNSFSNPSFSTPSSQQRLDEEQIEREIQINCIP